MTGCRTPPRRRHVIIERACVSGTCACSSPIARCRVSDESEKRACQRRTMRRGHVRGAQEHGLHRACVAYREERTCTFVDSDDELASDARRDGRCGSRAWGTSNAVSPGLGTGRPRARAGRAAQLSSLFGGTRRTAWSQWGEARRAGVSLSSHECSASSADAARDLSVVSVSLSPNSSFERLHGVWAGGES